MKQTKNTRLLLKVFLIILVAVNIMSVCFFGAEANAKQKKYKPYKRTVKVKITSIINSTKHGLKKTVSLKKKLKKGDKIKTVKSGDKELVKAKKISAKKIKITEGSGWESDENSESTVIGNTTVTVKTKKKGTIKVKVKVEDGFDESLKSHGVYFSTKESKMYFEKIIAELKVQLADTDKTIKEIYGKTFEAGVPTDYKKIVILEKYFKSHTSYSYGADGKTPDHSVAKLGWKAFYEGTFTGVCEQGAEAGYAIAQALGFNARVVKCSEINHAWLVVEAADASGVKFWCGVWVTSYAINLSWNQLPQYRYSPAEDDMLSIAYDYIRTGQGDDPGKPKFTYYPDLDWSKLAA